MNSTNFDNATVVELAAFTHEMNRQLCLLLGDNSQPEWEDAPEWQVESAIQGVMYHLNNPNSTPEDSHASWMEQKANDGWDYGEVKDSEAKTHPCMVPYEDLPWEQKMKDYLFITSIRTMMYAFEKEDEIKQDKNEEEE